VTSPSPPPAPAYDPPTTSVGVGTVVLIAIIMLVVDFMSRYVVHLWRSKRGIPEFWTKTLMRKTLKEPGCLPLRSLSIVAACNLMEGQGRSPETWWGSLSNIVSC
jgi:hypothetical protein